MARIKGLDGLRAIAILSVVAWHYLGAGDGPSSAPWRIFIIGRTGVDLFFVLSGYLITGILLANRGSSNYFPAFHGRRSFRILPIYFGMVAIYPERIRTLRVGITQFLDALISPPRRINLRMSLAPK